MQYDPLQELLNVSERLARTMEEALEPFVRVEAREGYWSPLSDILSVPEQMAIRIDLPGVPKDAVRLELLDRTLILSGVRPALTAPGTEMKIRSLECDRGAFRKAFSLPRDADAGGITSQLESGVLTITIPLAGTSQTRQVAID